MEHWYYIYAGLRVVSELPLPEWAVFEQPARPNDADIVIALNSAPPASPASCSQAAIPLITANEYRFHIPQTGDYWVRHGREIVVTPAPGAGAPEVRLFLLGSAWGALCYQRGLLALHASVIQVRERALAFCGATGSGKSSVAAWLVARGHALIGDDLCHFDIIEDKVCAYPSAPRLKLWRDALQALGQSDAGLERDHFRAAKFHVPGPAGFQPTGPLALRAICLLEWGPPGLVRLTGIAALRCLVAAATYRGELLEPMGQVAAHWQRCAELAKRAPVWVFSRPCDWSAMDVAMKRLIQFDISE